LKQKRIDLRVFLSQANTKLQRIEYENLAGLNKKPRCKDQLETLRSIISTNSQLLEGIEHQIIQMEHFFIEKEVSDASAIGETMLQTYIK